MREIESLLRSLNEEQQRAVTTLRGPLLVLAGAGTGKTRVITYRIANLLTQNVPPESILAMTFTKKAAGEMKERVAGLVGQRARNMQISTFHSLGHSILRHAHECVGLRAGWKVGEPKRRRELMDEVLRDVDRAGFDVYHDVTTALRQVSQAKNRGFEIDELIHADGLGEQLVGEVWMRYEARLRDANLIDLDDLVTLPLRILREQPRVLEAYNRRFRYVLIDEYQDTNEIQYQLTKLLLTEEQNICVVGDDDQAIYRFRGASVEKIRGFAFEFPLATVVTLVRNYRSSPQILSFSNAVIAGARERLDKELRPELDGSLPVELAQLGNEHSEREYVARRIAELHSQQGTAYDQMAVLVRMANERKAITELLTEASIPVATTKRTGVQVMTLHGSKGLEFPTVLLPGVEENMIPHFHSIQDGADSVEEERRLFYVGATRAQRRLIVSSSARRNHHRRTPSRFLDGLARQRYVRCVSA